MRNKIRNIVLLVIGAIILLLVFINGKDSKSNLSRRADMAFPRDYIYPGCVKPLGDNPENQGELNKTVKERYCEWYDNYIVHSQVFTDTLYVRSNYQPAGKEIATSCDLQGIGMLVTAMMAGADMSDVEYMTLPELSPKDTFDGLYRMYIRHPSVNPSNTDKALMSFQVDITEDVSADTNSAIMGDLMIAYALVVAHDQWGSDGAINYIEQARKIINAIKEREMSSVNRRPMLGDWYDWSSFRLANAIGTDATETGDDFTQKPYGTMTNSLMPHFFRIFYKVTKDHFWLDAVEETYTIVETFDTTSDTGLLSNFIVDNPPRPPQKGYLEGETDPTYGYTACLLPFNLALDYVFTGDARAKGRLDTIAQWLVNDPQHRLSDRFYCYYIKAGYNLNGIQYKWPQYPNYWYSHAFTAPFAAACMVAQDTSSDLSAGLDECFRAMKNGTGGTFEKSVNLLSLLLVSGNWWYPGQNLPPVTPDPLPTIGVNVDDYNDYYPASQLPPGRLAVNQVPQFISFGWNVDNDIEGLSWVNNTLAAGKTNPMGMGNAATYDGTAVGNTFFYTTKYLELPVFSPLLNDLWKSIISEGNHETGNHSHQKPGDLNGNTALNVWIKEIEGNESAINALMNNDVRQYGWRSPHAAYGKHLYPALKARGYYYDSSIAEGFNISAGDKKKYDGSNHVWPYTLDNGSEGHEVLKANGVKDFDLDQDMQGLWELPMYTLVVPPANKCLEYGLNYDLRLKLKGLFDWFDAENGSITGSDIMLFVTLNLDKAETLAILKYSLALKAEGNRAPLIIATHPEVYAERFDEQNPTLNTYYLTRREVLEEFTNYALAKESTRMVSYRKILDWVRNPAGFDGSLPPDLPTPAPTVTPMPVPENLSLLATTTVYASSQYNNDFGKDKAVDGLDSTTWGSNTADNTPYYIINLGKKCRLTKLAIKWHTPFYGKTIKLGVSDDMTNWTVVPVSSIGEDIVFDLSDMNIQHQYVGFLVTQKNEIVVGVKEVEVWGSY